MHIYTKQITMNLSARILIMRNIPLLKSLTEEQLLLLAEAAEYRKYPKNKLIYDLGCKVTHVCLIEKGSVKLGMLASCGKTLTKDIVYDGEIFSENVFGSQAISREFAETMMETRVFAQKTMDFKRLNPQTVANREKKGERGRKRERERKNGRKNSEDRQSERGDRTKTASGEIR